MKSKQKKWKDKAWLWFSIFIRLFYSDNYGYNLCYTCGKKMFWKGEGSQAGHFQAGRGNSVLLDETQVRPQCYGCNCGKSGEQYIFGKKLEKEYSEEEVQKMRQRKSQSLKVSAKEWEDKANYYRCEAVKIAEEKNLEI